MGPSKEEMRGRKGGKESKKECMHEREGTIEMTEKEDWT
jgi:hypothetical protein